MLKESCDTICKASIIMNVSSKRFFLVSNFHTYGIQHALYKYFIDHDASEVFFLNHPLHGITKEYTSTLEIYSKKKNTKTNKFSRQNLPDFLSYSIDFFMTVKQGIQISGKIDVFVGFNSMNTIPGLVLKLLGKVKYVITYSHSFKNVRYQNKLMNVLYKTVDSLAIRYSDSVWGLGEPLIKIRKKQGVAKEKIVLAQDGVNTKLFRPLPYHTKRRFLLVFVGLINEINGLELVIDALPDLVKENFDYTLDVIGEGEDLEKIKQKVALLRLQKHVRFHGIFSIEKLAAFLPMCGIGIATYKPVKDSTLKTTDPMKTKLYMAAGLPLVSTDIYMTAHEIRDHALGELIRYDVKEFIRAIKKITNEKRYKQYRKNNIHFVQKYDWNNIFTTACNNTNL